MKVYNQILILGLALVLVFAFKPYERGGKKLNADLNQSEMNNQEDNLSYALGVVLQANLEQGGFENLNYDEFARAMKEASAGTATMNVNEANAVVGKAQQAIQAQKAKEASAAGTKFLAENAAKEGVKTTASGLQYKVLREGTGEKPAASNKVTVHYEGRLTNGKIFDSSYKRGEPISFGLGQVIKGWTEGLQLMPVGSKYELYIPYQLGYGERGAGANIPPYATLIFVVELISFE